MKEGAFASEFRGLSKYQQGKDCWNEGGLPLDFLQNYR